MVRSNVLGRLFISGVLLLVASIAQGQEAMISGTITDTTGGVLPGVTITATHEATGNSFVAVTDQSGNFLMPVARDRSASRWSSPVLRP